MMPPISMRMPSATSVTPKLRGAAVCASVPASLSFWKNWKIVNPKPISDSDVRITDISVRSALMRVRWNDMPVRRIDSSVEMLSGAESRVTGVSVMATAPLSEQKLLDARPDPIQRDCKQNDRRERQQNCGDERDQTGELERHEAKGVDVRHHGIEVGRGGEVRLFEPFACRRPALEPLVLEGFADIPCERAVFGHALPPCLQEHGKEDHQGCREQDGDGDQQPGIEEKFRGRKSAALQHDVRRPSRRD